MYPLKALKRILTMYQSSFKDEVDKVSIKSFRNDDTDPTLENVGTDVDADNISVKSLKITYDDIDDDNVSVKNLVVKEPDEDNMSIKSYAIDGDYILSLHQRVPVQDAVPIPPPREINSKEARKDSLVENPDNSSVAETVENDDVTSEEETVTEKESYEEERSRKDFDSIIQENVARNKAEKNKSNVEVLEDIVREEGKDLPNVAELLAWAKGTKKPKTETFVLRKKNREDLLKKSVDTGAFEIVIKDKIVQENGAETMTTGKKKIEIEQKSDMQQATVVSKEWLENALKEHEQSSSANIVNMEFSSVSKGVHKAAIEANINGSVKEYSLVIKDAPKNDLASDKDTFVVADLGRKFGRFVDGLHLKTTLGEPFQRVIYADKQFAIFPDISDYKQSNSRILDEAHLKVGVKALAKLHATSYAYFNRNSDGVQEFSEILKVLVDKHFQPVATAEDKSEVKSLLDGQFENIITLLSESVSSSQLDRIKTLKGMLYNVFKEGRQSSSVFSTFCHGCPTVENFLFLYSEDGNPVDAKLVNFSNARIASSMTDFHTFVNTASDNARDDFLLRFVYYETLVTVLKTLGVKNGIISFDDLKKEFVKKKLYGYIEASCILSAAGKPVTTKKSAPLTRVNKSGGGNMVESKILGKFAPKIVAVGSFSPKQPKAEDDNEVIEKVAQLMTKAVNIH